MMVKMIMMITMRVLFDGDDDEEDDDDDEGAA